MLWTHRKKVSGSGVPERYHGRNGLNRFAEPHLISKKNATLMEYVLHAPFLVAAQIAPEAIKGETFAINLPGKLLGQPVKGIGDILKNLFR